MNEDLLTALLAYIDARVDEKIVQAEGYDSGNEFLRTLALKNDLIKLVRGQGK